MSNRHQRWTAGTANDQEVQTGPETYEEFELFTFKIAHQWEKAAMLRLGRFQRVVGPGPF